MKLEARLSEAEVQLEECKRKTVQAHADMANIRRRAEEDVKKARHYGQERLISDLLPILDGLESGLNVEVGENAFAKQIIKAWK
ncbi:MAG: nucleotide exchange factor GrpE [Gammaproteobacteria bacterium]